MLRGMCGKGMDGDESKPGQLWVRMAIKFRESDRMVTISARLYVVPTRDKCVRAVCAVVGVADVVRGGYS